MLNIDLPLPDRVKYPLETSTSYLGGNGDGFIYQGDQFRTKLPNVSIVYEKLTYTEAETILTAINSYITSQPARIIFNSTNFIIASEGIQEKRGNGLVDLKIALQGVF